MKGGGGGKAGPVIDAVVFAGTGEPVRKVATGAVVHVRGGGFGNDARRVSVRVGDARARPLPAPFSPDHMVIVVPSGAAGAETLRVEVDGAASEPVPLSVRSARGEDRSPGDPIRELVGSFCAYAGHAAGLGRAVAPLLEDRELRLAMETGAEGLEAMMELAPRSVESWIEASLAGGAEGASRLALDFYDGVLPGVGGTGALADITDGFVESVFGEGGPVDALLDGLTEAGEAGLDALFPDGIGLGDVGFLIHEGVKLAKAVEDFLKIFGPVGKIGEGISAIADGIDIIAQVLQWWAAKQAAKKAQEQTDRIEQGIERLEEKEDRNQRTVETLISDFRQKMESLIKGLAGMLGSKIEGQAWDLERMTSTTDRWNIREALEQLEEKLDRVEEKLDRAEEKGDRAEEKLDRAEEKLDRTEEKLDRVEEKLDRFTVLSAPEEGSVAHGRGSGGRVTAAVAARGRDGDVHLRAAVDAEAARLDDEAVWSDWEPFGRPGAGVVLAEVSLALQYQEGSDSRLEGLLSARDARGTVHHRRYVGDHARVLDASEWSEWESFLGSP